MTMISEPDMPAIDIGQQEQREQVVVVERPSKARAIAILVAAVPW